jgi:uncharacterized protein YchJ
MHKVADAIAAAVEFRALYSHRGSTSSLHENSCFLREDGAWVYAAALPL